MKLFCFKIKHCNFAKQKHIKMIKENKINRELVYSKCNGKCGYCGVPIEFNEMSIDHIIPQHIFLNPIKFRGSKKAYTPFFLTHLTYNDVDHEDNLMPACINCNSQKTRLPIEEYRLNVFNSNRYISLSWRHIYKNPIEFVNESTVLFYFETLDSDFFKSKEKQRSVLDTAILYLKKKRNVKLVRDDENFKVWANEYIEYILQLDNFHIWTLSCYSLEILEKNIFSIMLPKSNERFMYLMLVLDQENN